MKQYTITAASYANADIPNAAMDTQDLNQLLTLSGIPIAKISPELNQGSNVSVTGMEKAELMKKNNIKPGTPEWFQLWFARPFLTNEKPIE